MLDLTQAREIVRQIEDSVAETRANIDVRESLVNSLRILRLRSSDERLINEWRRELELTEIQQLSPYEQETAPSISRQLEPPERLALALITEALDIVYSNLLLPAELLHEISRSRGRLESVESFAFGENGLTVVPYSQRLQVVLPQARALFADMIDELSEHYDHRQVRELIHFRYGLRIENEEDS